MRRGFLWPEGLPRDTRAARRTLAGARTPPRRIVGKLSTYRDAIERAMNEEQKHADSSRAGGHRHWHWS